MTMTLTLMTRFDNPLDSFCSSSYRLVHF